MEQRPRADAAAELSVAKGPNGVCVFREDRRCSIHVRAGESALPIGCRHYPRVVRIDPRGVSLSLSHYCPTAASLLATDDPVHIVATGPPLALAEPVEGLDAREALPPLLRPDVLMDLDSYGAWEAGAVSIFSSVENAFEALRVIASATDELRTWTPGSAPLDTAVADAFSSAVGSRQGSPSWSDEGFRLAQSLNRGIVSLDGTVDPGALAGIDAAQRVIANYLAARAFGNWIAYQGCGLRTNVTWLRACHDIVCLLAVRFAADQGRQVTIPDVIEAIRQADYVMLHTIDTQDFADAARGVEH